MQSNVLPYTAWRRRSTKSSTSPWESSRRGGQIYSILCSPKREAHIADTEAYFQFFSFSFLGFLFHHGGQALKEDLAKRLGPAGRLEVINLENVGKGWSFRVITLWFKGKNAFFLIFQKKKDFAGVLNLLSPFHFANCANNLECFFESLGFLFSKFLYENLLVEYDMLLPQKVLQ